jgi:hypothetical protein
MGGKDLRARIRTFTDLIRLRNAGISFIGVFIGAIIFSLGQGINAVNVLVAAVSTSLILGAGNA